MSKASIFNPTGANNRNLSAEQALEVSSNSYMMQVALRLMGIEYQPGISIPTVDRQTEAYSKLRTAFASFGMGTKNRDRSSWRSNRDQHTCRQIRYGQ